MAPSPVPPPHARGGNAVPTPKRKKPKPKPPSPPRTPQPPAPPPRPFPQYAFPKIYNPATVASQASRAAQDAINQQLAAGMSALPTVEQQSAPYLQQIESEKGLGSAMLDALKGAQTYRVDLATGLPQAFRADAAATGGDAATGDRAAATLASFGTSAANQIAQQEAAAPAATAANTRIIQQRLQDLLTGPQGHDALERQLTSQIEQQRPGLELNYQNTYAQQAQVPFNEALQLATANTNYDLAQQTYGLNAKNAAYDRFYKGRQLGLQEQNARLREIGLKLQGQRATDSYNLAIARLKIQQQNANQAGQAQDSRAAAQAQAALRQARTSIVQQANTLYKRTQGTSGSGGSFEVHYFTPSGTGSSVTLVPHTETFKTADAMNQRYQQLSQMAQGAQAAVQNVTRLSEPGRGGTAGQSVGYLRNQAVNYGVQLLLQQAPWLPRAAATRMAQQIVAGVFGNAPPPSAPPAPPAHPGAN